MSRFHLYVHRAGSVVDDEQGMELASLSDARREAIAAIPSILADELLGGSIDLVGCVVIMNEANFPVLIVPFTEAVEVKGGFR